MSKKTMRVYCSGSYAPSNYGNHMLTENFVTFFSRSMDVPCEFGLAIIDDKEQRQALRQSIPGHIPLTYYNYCGVRAGANSLTRYAQGLLTLLQDALGPVRFRADVTTMLGGDCISEVYGTINGIFWLALLSWMTRYSKVFLLAQTVGPFHGWRIPWATRILNRCHIYTRDQWTIDYLTDTLHVKNVNPSCDLAFLDLPDQREDKSVLDRYGLSPREYFTLVISPFHTHYTNTFEQYLSRWTEMLEMLLKQEALGDKKLVLLVHVHRIHLKNEQEQAEPQMIQAVCERLGSEWNDRVVQITDMLPPSEARSILGNGEFTVTGRMHASISTYQRSVPAIALAYSPKFSGVVGAELQRSDLILDNPDREVWNSGKIVGALEEKVRYVLENRDRICRELEAILPQVQKKALFQIEDMVRILRP